MKQSYVYILGNRVGGAIYIGVTSDLIKRIFEHKEGKLKGFTSKYNIDKLLYTIFNFTKIGNSMKNKAESFGFPPRSERESEFIPSV